MTQNNKIIAVTGGIGSGKSTVTSLLKAHGYAVFSCDEINRELWQDEKYLQGLAQLFPDCIVGGTIDKQRLSRFVFSDAEKLKQLNDYAHPRIMQKLDERMQSESGLVFAEVPLLFEGGYQNRFDGIIVVTRNTELRIASVMARDGLSREEVLRRISRQVSYDKISDSRYYLIDNNEDREALDKKLRHILAQLSEK